MLAKSLGFRGLIHFTTLAVISLCLCLLSSINVRAQKTPSIFKTESGNKSNSTSATNMDYINALEGQYKQLEASNNDADREKAKVIRNKLIFIGVEQVDTEFNNYRKKSRKRSDLLQFIFDFLEVGASTAIAIVNGERAKEVIAEALTGFKGARTSFTRNFRLLETQILFNKMVSNRSQRLTAIYDKLNDPVLSYPWERARSELRDYFFAGTIDDALNSLSIDTGSEANTSQANLEQMKRTAGIVGEPTQAQRDESTSNFQKIRGISRIGLPAERDLTAERQKPEDSQDKDKIEQLTQTRQAVLDDLRGIFDAIEADTKLKPLVDRIPEAFGNDQRIMDALSRIREKRDPSVNDYDMVLTKLNGVITEELPQDPTLAGRLGRILSTSKTLKGNSP